jgi:glutathione S-transferase
LGIWYYRGDIGVDWRTIFVNAFFSPDKETAYPKYCETNRVRYMTALEGHLSSSDYAAKGPFVLGDRITYADFVIYQVLHDDGLTKEGNEVLAGYPKLKDLVQVMEARPNIEAFLRSDRYLG